MKKDPAAPADTRTMSVVHAALRRDLRRARLTLTATPAPSQDRRRALAAHLQWMMVFLDRHHTSEDAGLYPLVRQKNPAAAELLDAMDAEHDAIHPAMEQLAQVADAFGRDGGTTEADVLDALSRLESVLNPHLQREEQDMMPVVAATITAAEWDRWEQEHNIRRTRLPELARTGLWILDGQDPASEALMEALVPPPVRLLVRRVFGPGYRRRCALLWGGTPAADVPALPAGTAGASA